VYVSDFGQWAQDILSPVTPLYKFSPDVIVLLLAGSALFPRTILDPEAGHDTLEAERTHGLAEIEALIAAARRHSPGASLVVHTFSLPDRSPFGLLDLKQERGQRSRVEALNAGLVELVRDLPEVLLLDQERVEARHGKSRVRDDRLWYVAGIPFSESFLPVLAAEYIRIIRPLKGLVRKCVILDLDETLWGGVVGEDGLDGIKLGGNDAPGNAYYDFQLALDGLQRRGVLLAVCSKNNPEDVWPVIDGHPHMVLRRSHFVATRLNWRDKASNILEIARELSLGVDSIVFLDDNPAERALVRQQLPEVLTVEMPADPAYFVRTLLELDVFESLGLTDEDRQRGEMYRQSQARHEHEEIRTAPGDLRTHLESLQIAVTIRRATPFSIARIAQLVNKTNQFNLTTRRYTEAQVRAMADATDGWAVYSLNVTDRFGDQGLTGVALVRVGGKAWIIDSFLLSCRVLGRGVEDALLAHVVASAKAAGARLLHGVFVPTAKNAPARGFYPERGFHFLPSAPEADGGTVFELSLDAPEAQRERPTWLRLTEPCDD
jgi:FkbH-like protein